EEPESAELSLALPTPVPAAGCCCNNSNCCFSVLSKNEAMCFSAKTEQFPGIDALERSFAAAVTLVRGSADLSIQSEGHISDSILISNSTSARVSSSSVSKECACSSNFELAMFRWLTRKALSFGSERIETIASEIACDDEGGEGS